MPDIFYQKAYEAVCQNDPKILRKLRSTHFQDFDGLNEILEWLTPKQRCDAIYASWLESVNGPDSGVLLEVRNRLIQQGGLSANYLAEFAQNADDAFPREKGGEVRIWTQPGWLFVANNGRRFTGIDLFGLCRFFANGAKQIKTDELTIGKFGIGFKSCYRIGSEVWVHTWDKEERFSFRLPLSSSALPESHYDVGIFQTIVQLLRRTDSRTSQDELGYCTPEYHVSCPSEIDQVIQQSEGKYPAHGSVFAIRLHARGKEVLRERLKDQRNQVFELCPLFLRKVRTTQLEDTSLRLIEHETSAEHSIPSRVYAERVTIEAKTGDGSKSNARFWRLTESGAVRPWRIALHADSLFRLNFRREDEETTSLRDGVAYAYFPLSIPWPLRLHLHLDRPTNLDRSNWSPENPEEIRQQIVAAIDGLGRWLEHNRGIWNEDWSVAQLVERKPTKPMAGQFTDQPAWWVYEELGRQVQERPLLRTITGGFAKAIDSRCLSMRPGNAFREAWIELGKCVPGAWASRAWTNASDSEIWNVPRVKSEEILEFVKDIQEQGRTTKEADRSSQLLFTILVGLDVQRRGLLDECLRALFVPVANCTMMELFERSGGASLTDEWHALFRELAASLRDTELGARTIGRIEFSSQLQRFSRRAFNPSWPKVPTVMHDGLWNDKGDEFWTGMREECPRELTISVLKVLQVRIATQEFRPIGHVWIIERSVPYAFSSILSQVYPPRQTEYVQALRRWGLWEQYELGLIDGFALQLPQTLSVLLEAALAANSVQKWFEDCRRAQIEVDKVGRQWSATYGIAVRKSITLVLGPKVAELRNTMVLSRSIPEALRTVTSWLKGAVEAPSWLNDAVVDQISRSGEVEVLKNITVITMAELGEKLPDIARQLLGSYHTWAERTIASDQFQALEKIFSSPTKTDRRQLLVGLGPRTARALGSFVCFEETNSDANTYWLAQARPEEGARLPDGLRRFPSLEESCRSVRDLTLSVDLPKGGLKFTEAEVADDIITLPVIQRVLRAVPITAIYQHAPLKLTWHDDEDRCVFTHQNADFVVQEDRLYVSRLKVRAEDRQFEDILSIYSVHSSRDPEIEVAREEARALRAPLETVYNRFRDRIFAKLCCSFIENEGYAPRHVWRELLQNAENAYASMPDPRPEKRAFVLKVEELSDGRCRMTAINHGRRFNEIDRDGKARDDVERIISVGGDRQQTAFEIGRYHLGFKSVFSVTDNVEVKSGGREFTVKDLLLRHPPRPQVTPERADEPTSFSWTCSKTRAAEVSGVPLNAPIEGSSKFLRTTYVVFTRFTTEVQLDYRGTKRSLLIDRCEEEDSVLLTVTSPDKTEHAFRVWRGAISFGNKSEPRPYAVAVQCDAMDRPIAVAAGDQFFHLVFPTEHKFGVPFLIDGAFDMHGQDRGQLQDSSKNLSLITAAVAQLFDAAERQLAYDSSKETWLAWSRVLCPEEFWQAVKSFFTEKLGSAEDLRNRIKHHLLGCVPHKNRACRASSLTIPSALLRRFAAEHGDRFGIITEDWIDSEIEETARNLGLETNYTIGAWTHDWCSCNEVRNDLQRTLDLFQSKPLEVDEIRRARDVIAKYMAPNLEPLPFRSLDQIVNWWRDNNDADPYSLSGDLFTFITPESAVVAEPERASKLRRWLTNPETVEGRQVWYRMLSYACLLSVGRHHTEVMRFEEMLAEQQFFEKTSDCEFNVFAEEMFIQHLHRPFLNDTAGGEQADFLRRIFYDVKKVHHLVYRDDFAQTFLELCRRKDLADDLISFLRSGSLPGQQRWRGVLGQSALAPLFFVVRELRRLLVIDHTAADRTAFFVCRPVRRVARQLGWISEEKELQSDQDNLIEIAGIIYDKMYSDPQAKEYLLPYFDIPLIALDQSGILKPYQ